MSGEIARHCWPHRSIWPRCGQAHAHVLSREAKRQCARCRYQISLTAGTLFHKTHNPLPKWFAAIYLVSRDKGGISALRLSELLGVSCPSVHRMMRLLRNATRAWDRCYPLTGYIEVDNALVGGKQPGKRGCSLAERTPFSGFALGSRRRSAS